MSTPNQPDSSSSTGGPQLVIDNKDTQILSFQGVWNQQEFNATQTGTGSATQFSWSTDDGVSVSFIFPKPASAVFFYGLPQPFGGLYNICIDCNPNDQRSNETVDAASKGGSDNQFTSRVMYSKFFDKPGVHSVILTNARDPKGQPAGNSRITLDKFILIVDGATSQTTVTSPSPTTSSSSSTSSSTQSAATADMKTSTPVGAIVGGVVGGLVLLATVGLLLWLRRRKSRRRAVSLDQPDHLDPVIEPFYINPTGAGGAHGNGSHVFASSASEPYTSSGPTYASSRPTYSSSDGPSMSQRYESDAGPVRSLSIRTNPPLYDQVFATDGSSGGRQSEPPPLPTKSAPAFRPLPRIATNGDHPDVVD